MFFDSYFFILIIPAAILAIWAQSRVNSTYRQFSQVAGAKGYTGEQAAMRIMQGAGITDVPVEHVSGNLTDHYDPSHRILRLSDGVFNSTSVAALGIAAHEAGHAIQHHEGYAPLRIRNAIVPITQFGSRMAMPLLLIGVLLGGLGGTTGLGWIMIQIGLWGYGLCVVFQLLTLPVEFNASSRALRLLEDGGILMDSELTGARKVLSAAALTYLAALATALASFLRLFLLFGGGRRGRD